jgi:glyoxylase-like metal-dependent hydrolase (beta-lactamase superfamily II)
MTDTADPLTYPYETTPAPASTMEVAPGVYWLQMPLPMSLNHINLYLLEGRNGWTVVDTGIRGTETRDLWLDLFDKQLHGKPVDQVICTHMHPDHTGQAGFISEYWHAPLLMSYAEYYQARVMNTMMRDGGTWQMGEYFVRAGIDQGFLEQMREGRSDFMPDAEDRPLPGSFLRMKDGDRLDIGGNQWLVITGNGHSPEHVCLYCKELRILISGDQILPVITSNVSVQPTEPFANPLTGWLESHERFKKLLPDDILVLPAHNQPFYGVQERLQQLIDHHEDRMLLLEENCVEPQKAIDLLPHLFMRKLESYSLFMGLGECIAHLHCLMERKKIERTLEKDVFLYKSIDATLAARARPGHHERPDESPQMV